MPHNQASNTPKLTLTPGPLRLSPPPRCVPSLGVSGAPSTVVTSSERSSHPLSALVFCNVQTACWVAGPPEDGCGVSAGVLEGRAELKRSKGSIPKSKGTPSTPPWTRPNPDRSEPQHLLFSIRQKSRWQLIFWEATLATGAVCRAPGGLSHQLFLQSTSQTRIGIALHRQAR